MVNDSIVATVGSLPPSHIAWIIAQVLLLRFLSMSMYTGCPSFFVYWDTADMFSPDIDGLHRLWGERMMPYQY